MDNVESIYNKKIKMAEQLLWVDTQFATIYDKQTKQLQHVVILFLEGPGGKIYKAINDVKVIEMLNDGFKQATPQFEKHREQATPILEANPPHS